MEPPRSRTNSVASSIASTALHKRSASTKIPDTRITGPTVLSSFVRNIRLLNLDRLPDWPGVTPASLTQDARTRIRGAEWCLYRLFRIYDPATTLDKLQPFFPPLEPLQSINLRAALYRCLNDAKKSGVLGREAVLRKSMLDDCQGDRFWELCLSFSAAVVRKVTVEKHDTPYRPVAERIGVAQSLGKNKRDSMIPLAVAHKAALTKVLFEKERKRQTFGRLYDVLMDKEADLQDRKVHVQQRSQGWSQKAIFAQDVLDKGWVGSHELRDALTFSDDAASGDSLLTKSFDQVWRLNERNRLFSRETTEIGILEDLENRTRQQKRRLQRWQQFHEKLLGSKPQPPTDPTAAAKALQLRFDGHQSMSLRDMANNSQSTSPLKPHVRHDSATKYDDILTAMREELRKKSVAATSPEKKPTVPRSRAETLRKPNESQESINKTDESHHRSQSVTAVPVRPPHMAKQLSSRSRSYHQPKVISQREPIPLKSEIFSPLKSKGSSMSPSPRSAVSALTSPVEEPSPGDQLDSASEGAPWRPRQHSDLNGAIDNAHGLDISASQPHTRNSSDASTPRTARSGSMNLDSAIELPSELTPVLPSRNVDTVGRTVRPSLADRTRMSMAIKSSDDIHGFLPEPETTHQDIPERADTPVRSDSGDYAHLVSERRTTLQERTRHSISLAPQTAPLARKKSHNRSRTSIYPINQFETPQKTQRRSTVTFDPNIAAQLGEMNTPREQRDITPRDKLFEQDAEYASIFKPRPKVALSPIASPSFVDSPIDGIDEADLQAVGRNSPLGVR